MSQEEYERSHVDVRVLQTGYLELKPRLFVMFTKGIVINVAKEAADRLAKKGQVEIVCDEQE